MKTKAKSRIWDTLSSAAAALGLDKAVLQEARASGAPGFRHGRVYEQPLLAWLRVHPDIKGVSTRTRLQNAKLEQECRKLKLANDALEAKLVPRANIVASIERVRAALEPILKRRLGEEWPLGASVLDIPGNRIFGAKIGDAIREDFKKLADLWY